RSAPSQKNLASSVTIGAIRVGFAGGAVGVVMGEKIRTRRRGGMMQKGELAGRATAREGSPPGDACTFLPWSSNAAVHGRILPRQTSSANPIESAAKITHAIRRAARPRPDPADD